MAFLDFLLVFISSKQQSVPLYINKTKYLFIPSQQFFTKEICEKQINSKVNISLYNCSFYSIKPVIGSCIHISLSSLSSPISDIINCSFTNCTSNQYGGAIYLYSYQSSSIFNFKNCTFLYNNSNREGGAFYAKLSSYSDFLLLDNCFFNNNFLAPPKYLTYSSGGALFSNGYNVNITNCNFSNNYIISCIDNQTCNFYGGACSSYYAYTVNFMRCIFSNNFLKITVHPLANLIEYGDISMHGGAISGSKNVIECIFINNFIQSTTLFIKYEGDFKYFNIKAGALSNVQNASDCFFISNSIYCNHTFQTITESTSQMVIEAGALYSSDSKNEINRCSFINNSIYGYIYDWQTKISYDILFEGGAISTSSKLIDSIFINNTIKVSCYFTNSPNELHISLKGAAVNYYITKNDYYNCSFQNNTLYVDNPDNTQSYTSNSLIVNIKGGIIMADMNFSDCSFINNTVYSFISNCIIQGGEFYIRMIYLNNCCFINNSIYINADDLSITGGIMYVESSANLNNCIFNNNCCNHRGKNNLYINGIFYFGGNQIYRFNNCDFYNNSVIGYEYSNSFNKIVYTTYQLEISFCHFIDNKFYLYKNSTQLKGCALLHSGNNLSVYNCTFVNNSVFAEGNSSVGKIWAIYQSSTSFTIISCYFSNNAVYTNLDSTLPYGSDVYCNSNTINFDSCCFNNTKVGCAGAIFFSKKDFSVIINNCSINIKNQYELKSLLFFQNSPCNKLVFTNNEITIHQSNHLFIFKGNSNIIANDCSFSNNCIIPYNSSFFKDKINLIDSVSFNQITFAQAFDKCFFQTDLFLPSTIFTFSNDFSQSFIFTKTMKFSESILFSKSNDFSESNLYSKSSIFSESNMFSRSNEFSKSKKYDEFDLFSKSNDFSESSMLSKPYVFSKSNEYSKYSIFLQSNEFNASIMFSIHKTSDFTLNLNSDDIEKCESLTFLSSHEFTRNDNFSFSDHFHETSIEKYSSQKVTYSKSFSLTLLYRRSVSFSISFCATNIYTMSYFKEEGTYMLISTQSFYIDNFPYIIYYLSPSYSITFIAYLIKTKNITPEQLIAIVCGSTSVFFFILTIIILIIQRMNKNRSNYDDYFTSSDDDKLNKEQELEELGRISSSENDLNFWL